MSKYKTMVYIVSHEDPESSSIYAVCARRVTARKMYEKLLKKLIKETEELAVHDEREDRESTFYKAQLAKLKECKFPNIRPRGFMLCWPRVEKHGVLD